MNLYKMLSIISGTKKCTTLIFIVMICECGFSWSVIMRDIDKETYRLEFTHIIYDR